VVDGNGKTPTQEIDWYVCPKGHAGRSGMTFTIDLPDLPFPHGPENHYCMACLLCDVIQRLKLQPLKHEIKTVPLVESEQEEG